MNTKYKALDLWLSNYTPIGSWLYFNVSNIEVDNASLNSVSGPRQLKTFNDGSKECELNFSIILIKNYDVGTSTTNLEAMKECEQLIKWCEQQVAEDKLPVFTDNCMATNVEILNNVPDLSIDNEQLLAKYQILGKTTYLEMKGE